MKIHRLTVRILFVFICILCAEAIVAQNYANVNVVVIKKNGKVIEGAKIAVFEKDSLITEHKASKGETLKIKLEANTIYRIEFGGHNGWVKKKLKILTFDLKENLEDYTIEMELFKFKTGMDISPFEKEIGMLKYNSKLKSFDVILNKER